MVFIFDELITYLPLNFPPNQLCNELSENAKMESVIFLACQLMKSVAKEQPTIIVFENAQWYVNEN